MADLGAIGISSSGARSSTLTEPWRCRSIILGANLMAIGGRDATEGDPLTPCLRLDARGRWRFRWAVKAGTRTISARCKQAINLSPRPTVVIKANPEVGLVGDVVGTAPNGTGWVTIGPVTFAPTVSGAVWVELTANLDLPIYTAPCYFDHVRRG